MASDLKYTIVGRYMDGTNVVGYHLLSNDGNGARRFSREQVIYLVGRGHVANCKGQIYKEEVLLRGVGISLNNLPVIDEKTGNMRNTENIGRIPRGATNDQALSQFNIVARIVEGNRNIGFIVRNAGGVEKKISRANVEKLASELLIGNARVQNYGGSKILRLINGKLEDLPIYNK